VTTAERLGALDPAAYDEAQRRAAEAFRATRGHPPFGPFERLIRSPEVLTHAQAIGEYLRYRSAIGMALSELVILVTAREWRQAYEWSMHAQIALTEGVRPEVVEAIGEGRRPEGLSEAEAIAYDFSVALHRERQVGDDLYARALAAFGEQGVIDLTAVNGYYAFLAMQMNVLRTPPAEGGAEVPWLRAGGAAGRAEGRPGEGRRPRPDGEKGRAPWP
jgi:4-carboxymuconolactone decarboxylase